MVFGLRICIYEFDIYESDPPLILKFVSRKACILYSEYGLFKKPKLAIDETMEFTKDDIGGGLIDKVFFNTKKFKTINNLWKK